MRMRRLVAAFVAALPLAALAGGPVSICGPATQPSASNVAVKYPGNSVTLTLDQGDLGPLANGTANAMVATSAAKWTDVWTANVTISISASPLPADVTSANFTTYYNNFTDGINPVIYDTDGSIVDAILGGAASDSVIGFGGSASSGYPTCTYTEGQVVVSGKLLASGAITQAQMANDITHEIGHLIGLDHTQIDGAQGVSLFNAPVMYPIVYRTTTSLHEDDIAAVTALYPDTTVNSAYGTITGQFSTAGGAPLLGANIWAQGTGGTFSNVSDALAQGTGAFSLKLPPGTYTLRAQAIETQFTGGSGVGPYSSDPTDGSFQPPFYTSANGGGTPFSATLGGGTPTQIGIVAGCTSSVVFRIDGTGSVLGDCPTVPFPPFANGPSGVVRTITPTYNWYPSSGATSYTIRVKDSSNVTVVNTTVSWMMASCTGTCFYTPTTALTDGATYTWSVSASNAAGASAFSIPITFTVSLAPPAAPTLISPSGTIATATPTFAWTASAHTVIYNLSVFDSANAIVMSQLVSPSDAGCGAGTGTCSVTPSSGFANGSYTWSVVAQDAAGGGVAGPVAFTVSAVPPAPVQVAPSGTVNTATPQFQWRASVGATSYTLRVQDSTGNFVDTSVTPTDAGCASGGICMLTPSTALANDTYSWWVRAWNAVGHSTWSTGLAVMVSAPMPPPIPPAPTPISPTGTLTTATPVFTWSAESLAASYRVQAFDSSNAVAVDMLVLPNSTQCPTGSATCSATGPSLVNGSYTWQVGAFNFFGVGWSSPVSFTVNVATSSIPNPPMQIAPSGTVLSSTPTFSWISNPLATSYQLLVQNGAGQVINTTLAAAAFGCSAGGATCTFVPTTPLADGTYSWFVRGWNSVGHSTWSTGLAVTVVTPPATPPLISPSGTIATATPTYSWSASPSATSYHLFVNYSGGNVVIDIATTPSAAGCGSGTGTCSFTPPNALANGSYTWTVAAINLAGGSMNPGLPFTVSAAALPAAPTQIGPNGTTMTATPTYSWSSSSGATSYRLLVQSSAGTTIDATYLASDVGCSAGGTCSITPSTVLANGGMYSWWARANNASGHSTWSAGMVFTVNASVPMPGAPTLISPAGTMSTASPTYIWGASALATSYTLTVFDGTGTTQLVNLGLAPSDAGCAAGTGTCSFTPSNTLTNGNYLWTAAATNSAGTSAITPGMTFTVNTSGGVPAAPAQIGPNGPVTTATPTYSWTASSSATSYILLVQSSSGTLINATYAQADLGVGCSGSGICSITPSTALMNGGVCSWWVRALNASGHSTWSAGMAITVNATTSGVPAAPTQISPNGNVATTTPAYEWMPSTGATSYRLLVQSSSGTVIDTTYLPTDVGCSAGGTCSTMPPTALASHTTYSWWVRANNASGHSTWSSGMAITTP